MSDKRPPRLTKINKFEQIWLDLLLDGGLNEFSAIQAREYLLEQRNHFGRKYRRVPALPRLNSILRKSPHFDKQSSDCWLRVKEGVK